MILLEPLRSKLVVRPMTSFSIGWREALVRYRDNLSKWAPKLILVTASKSMSLAHTILRCFRCLSCIRFSPSKPSCGAVADQCSSAIWQKVFPQPGGGWPFTSTLLQAPAMPRAQPRQTSRACGREAVSINGPRCCTSRSCGRAAHPTEAETR